MKNMLLGLLALLLLGSCAFSAAPDTSGNVTIRVGGESGRAVLPSEVTSQFRYTFIFTGPGEAFTRELPAGAGTLSLTLEPGTWTIGANAYTPEGYPAGTGTVAVTITAGSNSVQIPMTRALYLVIDSGGDSAFTIPTNTASAYDWTIDWGDGVVETRTGTGAVDTGIDHSFPAANTEYTVSITPGGPGGHAAFGFYINVSGSGFNPANPSFPPGANSAANRNKVKKALGHIQENTGASDAWADGTFAYCTNLTELSPDLLPAVNNGTANIFRLMFAGCTALTALPEGFQIPALPPTGVDNAFYVMFYSSGLRTVNLPTATYIGSFMFSACSSLKTINLPEARIIGGSAFEESPLSAVSLPKVTEIGNSAFEQTAVTTVNLPQLTTLGEMAFKECHNLATVQIPTVNFIGAKAFTECTSLGTITLGAVPPTVGKEMFDGIVSPQTLTLRVPVGTTGLYDAAWQNAFRGGGSPGTAGTPSTPSTPGTANPFISIGGLETY